MLRKFLLLMLFSTMPVQGRDPFAPPPQPCQAAAPLWVYRGLVSQGERSVAFVQQPGGKWWRVRTGQALPDGLRVHSVARDAVVVQSTLPCQPQLLNWVYQEKHDEGNQKVVVTVVTGHQHAGRTGKQSVAGSRRRAGSTGASGTGRK